MSSTSEMLHPGDPVYHPRHGFGTVHELTRRDPTRLIRSDAASATKPGQEQDYYDIQLLERGSLLVPVSRAESVGLRLLTNGVADITARLDMPAEKLPDNPRERAAVLHARERSFEPTALTDTVRDMVSLCRGRSLTVSEKTWLDNSCERLSTEAALVDRIDKAEARAAIWAAVKRIGAGS